MNEKKTIIIVDEVWMGHVPTFHKIIVSSFLKLGHPVLSISPKPDDVKKWMDQQDVDIKNLTIVLFEFNAHDLESRFSFIKKLKNYFINLYLSLLIKTNMFEKTVQSRRKYEHAKLLWQKADEAIGHLTLRKKQDDILVIFPFIDHKFVTKGITNSFIETCFRFNWVGLCIRPLVLLEEEGNNWLTAIFHAKNCKGLLMCDETLEGKLKKVITNNIWVFPEVTDTSLPKTASELEHNIKIKAGKRKIISLIGALMPIKNIILLLNAAERSEKENLPYFFVIAGHFLNEGWSKEDLTFFMKRNENQPKNCYINLNRLDEPDLNSIIRSSDIIFAAYRNANYSSNIMTKSAYFNKPVIVSKGYLMEDRTVKNKLGLSIDQDSVNELQEAIKTMASKEWQNTFNKTGLTNFFEMHSQNAVTKRMGELIKTIS